MSCRAIQGQTSPHLWPVGVSPAQRKELAERAPQSGGPVSKWRAAKLAFEKQYWEELLKATGGSPIRAARLAGVNRTWLHGRLRKVGIPPSHTPRRGGSRWEELGL